jgi:hypothetical protein
MTPAPKSSSHKKKKQTRLSCTKALNSAKKKIDLSTPEASFITRPVTQSQDEIVPVSPTTLVHSPLSVFPLAVPVTRSAHHRRPVGSPLADNDAISEMVSGLPLRRLAFDETTTTAERGVPTVTQTAVTLSVPDPVEPDDKGKLDNTARQSQLQAEANSHVNSNPGRNGTVNLNKKKKKNSKVAAFKLTSSSVHNLLRHRELDQLKKAIEEGVIKKANPNTSLKKSLNFFQTQTYTSHVTVVSGQSRRLATKKAQAATTLPHIVYEASQPTFDIKRASNAAPDIPWNHIVPSFNLDSRRLRRYIVEDVMFSNPLTRDRFLLLVCVESPGFAATFLNIYNHQRPYRPAIQFEQLVYIQIVAEVVKNSYQDSFLHGLNDIDTVKYLLTRVGGGGIGLNFKNCPTFLDIELKFATVIEDSDMFQVWGTAKSGRDFKPSIRNLKN